MKIRTGQVGGTQQGSSSAKAGKTDGRFQTLLDHELGEVAPTHSTTSSEEREGGRQQQPYRLISDATRLLDDAIVQIETSDNPQDKTLASLQQLRNELVSLSHSNPALNDAKVILSVETERLKSW